MPLFLWIVITYKSKARQRRLLLCTVLRPSSWQPLIDKRRTLNRFYGIGNLISPQVNEQKLLHHPLEYPHVIILILKTSTSDNASKNRYSASQLERRPAAPQGRPVICSRFMKLSLDSPVLLHGELNHPRLFNNTVKNFILLLQQEVL